eukprot:6477400-Amphidinium_carterae.1
MGKTISAHSNTVFRKVERFGCFLEALCVSVLCTFKATCKLPSSLPPNFVHLSFPFDCLRLLGFKSNKVKSKDHVQPAAGGACFRSSLCVATKVVLLRKRKGQCKQDNKPHHAESDFSM